MKWRDPSSVDIEVTMGDDLRTFPVMFLSRLLTCLVPAGPTRTAGTCLAFRFKFREKVNLLPS